MQMVIITSAYIPVVLCFSSGVICGHLYTALLEVLISEGTWYKYVQSWDL